VAVVDAVVAGIGEMMDDRAGRWVLDVVHDAVT
jgi:hypothetical protein